VKAHWARAAALLLLIAGGYLLAGEAGLLEVLGNPSARMRALASLRSATGTWWVGPAFSLAYAASVAFAIPASVLTLLGGAAFGLGRGILWVSLGANLGASAGFCIARRLGRSALEGFLGHRLGVFDRISAAAGFNGVLVLRLLPVAPFSLLNFAFGLTQISWTDYALATVIGILPGTVIYVFFADALLAGSAAAGQEAGIRALLAGLLLAGFSLLTRWLLRRRSRHAS
jgi:uncharacterized membrane protein YdjX (TVP38/TMEM64 family)